MGVGFISWVTLPRGKWQVASGRKMLIIFAVEANDKDSRLLFNAFLHRLDHTFNPDKIEHFPVRNIPTSIFDRIAGAIAQERYDSLGVYRFRTNTTTALFTYVVGKEQEARE